MRILIINGPSINLLGERQPDLYGSSSYQDLEITLQDFANDHTIECEVHQTNFEGIIIDLLHYAHQRKFDGVVLNAGAYTHYSYAIYDAILAITPPVIEVHLTNPKEREEAFRHVSVIESACRTSFVGKGFNSYLEALNYLLSELK